MTVVVKGNGQYIAANATAQSATFTGPITNQFEFTNTSTTQPAFVGVFTTNVTATFGHPGTGSPNIGLCVLPNSSKIVVGDFGAQYQGNVWVNAITTANTAAVYVAPVLSSN